MTRWYECPAVRPRKGWLRRVMESLRGLLRWRGRCWWTRARRGGVTWRLGRFCGAG